MSRRLLATSSAHFGRDRFIVLRGDPLESNPFVPKGYYLKINVGFDGEAALTAGVYVGYDGGPVYREVSADASEIISRPDMRSVWRHLAASYDGKRLALFVDGREVAVSVFNEAMPPASLPPGYFPLTVGYGWTGLIDEVRLWTEARPEEEVLRLMVCPPPLDAPTLAIALTFNDGYGSSLNTTLSYNVNGTFGRGSLDPWLPAGMSTLEWTEYGAPTIVGSGPSPTASTLAVSILPPPSDGADMAVCPEGGCHVSAGGEEEEAVPVAPAGTAFRMRIEARDDCGYRLPAESGVAAEALELNITMRTVEWFSNEAEGEHPLDISVHVTPPDLKATTEGAYCGEYEGRFTGERNMKYAYELSYAHSVQTAEFSLTAVGAYELEATFDGMPITPTTPTSVHIMPGRIVAVATGVPPLVEAGVASYFIVDTFDAFDNALLVGGAEIIVSLPIRHDPMDEMLSKESEAPAIDFEKPIDSGDGTYRVIFTPLAEGIHKAEVSVGGTSASTFIEIFVTKAVLSPVSLSSSTPPPHRFGHASASLDGALYIWGGVGANKGYLGDLWRLKLEEEQVFTHRIGPFLVPPGVRIARLEFDTAAAIVSYTMLPQCDDVRFSDERGDSLPYFLISCGSATTVALVKLSPKHALATTAVHIYLHYGNPWASRPHMVMDIFAYFYSFEDGSDPLPGFTHALLQGRAFPVPDACPALRSGQSGADAPYRTGRSLSAREFDVDENARDWLARPSDVENVDGGSGPDEEVFGAPTTEGGEGRGREVNGVEHGEDNTDVREKVNGGGGGWNVQPDDGSAFSSAEGLATDGMRALNVKVFKVGERAFEGAPLAERMVDSGSEFLLRAVLYDNGALRGLQHAVGVRGEGCGSFWVGVSTDESEGFYVVWGLDGGPAVTTVARRAGWVDIEVWSDGETIVVWIERDWAHMEPSEGFTPRRLALMAGPGSRPALWDEVAFVGRPVGHSVLAREAQEGGTSTRACWMVGPTWSELLPTNPGPPARYSAKAVEHEGNLYVFGGVRSHYFFNDVWRYNVQENTWTYIHPMLLSDGMPTPRSDFSAVTLDGCMYIFGGTTGTNIQILSDLWRFTFATKEWTLVHAGDIPGLARLGHTAVVSTRLQKMAVFGGHNGITSLADLWIFDFERNSWEQSDMGGPSPRYGHSATLSNTDNMYVLGGSNEGYIVFDDVWRLDSSTGMWDSEAYEKGTGTFRYGHSSVLVGSHLVAFGGQGNGDMHQDIHELYLP